jgi:hypothetical protein
MTESTPIFFKAWDTLSHELFGHGIDKIRGLTRSESRARNRANQVRILRGKRIRNAMGPALW